jgi:hypothetical protein
LCRGEEGNSAREAGSGVRHCLHAHAARIAFAAIAAPTLKRKKKIETDLIGKLNNSESLFSVGTPALGNGSHGDAAGSVQRKQTDQEAVRRHNFPSRHRHELSGIAYPGGIPHSGRKRLVADA